MRRTTNNSIELWVPVPPSVNTLFRNAGTGDRVRHRIRSKAYQTWINTAAAEIMIQKPPKVPGPVSLEMYHTRTNKRADASNYIKAIEDLLVEMDVIDDDRNVVSVLSRWVNGTGGTRVIISPDRL